MTIPKKMPSPRHKIHQLFCPANNGCRYAGGLPSMKGVDACAKLDELLDFNDEMVLHTKARELCDEGEKLRTSGKRVPQYVLNSWFGAATLIEPYEKQQAHDPVAFPDNYHPGELRPDCPGCVAGREHYHRKKDGSPVMVADVPRETSGGDDAPAI